MDDGDRGRRTRFKSEYHAQSKRSTSRRIRAPTRKHSVIVNPSVEPNIPEVPSDIPLEALGTYSENEESEPSGGFLNRFYHRAYRSVRNLRRSTTRNRNRRPTQASLAADFVNYPESKEGVENGVYPSNDEDYAGTETPTNEEDLGIDTLRRRVSRQDSIILDEEPDRCAVMSKRIVSLVMFSAILVLATFSKVCFVAIASKYNDSLVVPQSNETASPMKSLQENSITFIQLVVILMTPQLFTAIRMFFGGIVGKSSKTYPWPSTGAMIFGVLMSILEAAALCGFVFIIAPHIGPPATILMLTGIYIFTGLVGINWCCRSPAEEETSLRPESESPRKRRLRRCWNGSGANFLGTVFQFLGLTGSLAVACYLEWIDDPINNPSDVTTEKWIAVLRLVITIILIPVILSFVWSRVIQKLIHKCNSSQATPVDGYDSLPSSASMTNLHEIRGKISYLKASRRGGFLYALVRLTVIPFISYGYARAAGILVDIPLGFQNWTPLDKAILLLQILSALSVFFLSVVSLWTTLQKWAFTLPLLLSTPAALAWFWLAQIYQVSIFPFYQETIYFIPYDNLYYLYAMAALVLLWFGQILILGYRIWMRPKFALARERTLFLVPHFDCVFLDSYLLLNRHSAQTSFCNRSPSGCMRNTKKKPVIFICSTMYHEAEHEMKQMLASIYRVAKGLKENRSRYALHEHRQPHYESHIFFDGAVTKSGDFNDFVLQLMSLLEETLHIKLEDVEKIKTPYGYQMKWQVGELPFCIHLKDNTRVKNKKRWSQVMYMSYILKHRMKDLNEIGRPIYDPTYSYILTTDADIDFTADAVKALLDFLARDDSVGAVCARTHPLGSGPMVWYQIFEYAFGHWFQKSAEHVLGCVLCCPGCFSVFRVSAIADVLDTYQSNVTTASEFLTKDMGEDRWLCTLMVEKGWRLEYSALSEDSTYCPEEFNEFFNQRRRWVPSTVANLVQMIVKAPKMAANNDSISYLFITYQLIIIVSTAVSPATVILVVASGLFSAYQVNVTMMIVILSIVTVLFGIICVTFPEKIQLNVAKLLTVLSGILMIVSFVGIFSSTIDFLIPDPNNATITLEQRIEEGGVTVDSVYLWGFAAIVIVAGLLHFSEILVLFHFIWYILALPSAYLLLLIYSAANLHVRSWGTRVGATAKVVKQDQSKYETYKAKFLAWYASFVSFVKSKLKKKKAGEAPVEEVSKKKVDAVEEDERFVKVEVEHKPMNDEAMDWLNEIECERFIEDFTECGYTRLDFIAGINRKDLTDHIGVKTQGYIRRLEKAIKALPAPGFLAHTSPPTSVQEFLDLVHLSEYMPLFRANGFYLNSDFEHLLELSGDDFKAMGIKKAHIKVILAGLQHARNPTCRELKISKTKRIIDQKAGGILRYDEKEFWEGMANGVLRPEPSHANSNTDELKEKLYGLRNSVLLAMLVINVIWMVLLLTIDLTYFESLGIDSSLLPIAFSVLYFGVILIQFAALVVHRVETLAQYVARTNIKQRPL